jgi:ABC-type uncharacterized transport system fused permease/ATPase subunit
MPAAAPLVGPEPISVSRTLRYDRTFFRRLYRLSRPYWVRKGSIGSWLTLLFLLGTVVAYSVCGAWITEVMADQTHALINRGRVFCRSGSSSELQSPARLWFSDAICFWMRRPALLISQPNARTTTLWPADSGITCLTSSRA